MPPPEPEIHNRENNNSPKHQNIPVHRNRIRVWHRREESHRKRQRQEHNAEDIERQAPSTKREARWEQGLSAKTFDDDAGDGDDVGGEEGAGAERGHDVEGDGAADVDEGEEYGEDVGENDGIEGDVPAGADLWGLSASWVLRRENGFVGCREYLHMPTSSRTGALDHEQKPTLDGSSWRYSSRTRT